ncbi:ribonuclease H-like domain-containing protein [Tanacetum coccineum]
MSQPANDEFSQHLSDEESTMKIASGMKEEYDIWAMEMEHYLEYIDNEVWKVIQNGNSKKRISTRKDGIVRVLSPVTAAEIKLFGGNANSKKMQKAVFKQQFEALKYQLEGLEKGYDRFQQLLSQLEAHGAEVSTEDANHKFLRSLPPAWSNLAMTMRTNPVIDIYLLIDRQYLRVFEQEFKVRGGFQKTSSSAQNVAFISQSKSSTNKVKSGFSSAYSSCTPSTSSTNIPEKEVLAGFADEVIYSLFAKQSEDWDLLHEDLEQIDDVDIEEMDINWQIAMIAIRMKKFYKKTGRRVRVDGKTPGTHDGKKKRDSFYQHQEAGKQEKNQMGLLTMDDGIVNWGEHTEAEETNHALMAISSSNEVTLCSKTCIDSYNTLKTLCDEQMNQLGDQEAQILAYSQAVKKLEAQLVPQKPKISVSDDNSSEHSTCQSNDSEGSCGNTSEHSFETESESLSEPNEMSKLRLEVANEKDVSAPKSKEVEPSCVSHIKTPRQPLKDKETIPLNLSHLIKDCDYYEKKMARRGLHTDLDKDDSEDSDEVGEQEESVTGTKTLINHVPVAMKIPSIATYKIIKQGEKGVYQIVREDGTDVVYINFGAMLKDISRDDLTELYRIVMNRYGMDGPEDKLEKVFWKYLKNMFEEPLSTDPIWSELGHQRIINKRRRLEVLQIKNNLKNSIYNILRKLKVFKVKIKNVLKELEVHKLDPDDSPMPELKIFHKSETGIFDEASYDEEGVITDFNSLPTEIEVSPTPTLRIHNIHPKSQILGDPKSAVQTRSKVQQKSGAHALFSFIQKQQRNNHKDQQHCLFACFLSQEEPKKIAEALQDDSWVQAMQEELLQFKLQQVWVLVDLPQGMKVIEKHGYKRGTIDKTLFIKRDKKDIMLVQVFQMSSMGELTFFLGLQVKQNKAGIFISQDKYVAEILKKFDLVNVKTAITPMETKVALTKDEEAVDVDVTPKNFTSHACEENLESTLRGKPNLGLWYPRESPFDLEAFSDSDYGGSNLDRNPQHVVCQFLVKTYLNGNARNNQVATCYSLKLNMYCCKIVVDKNSMDLQMYDRGFRGAPRPLLPVMLLVASTNPNAGQAHTDVAPSQPSSSTIPVPSTSLPPVQSPPSTPTPIPASTPTPIPASTPTPIPETDPKPMEHTFEEPSPAHQHFSPPQDQAQEQISVDDLLHLVPQLMTSVDSLEKELKQTKLTMEGAIVKLVKKVKKLEGILKRKNVVFLESEEEEPEDQGRKSQDDPLVSLVQGLVTPSKSTVNISGEEQIRSEYKRRKETKGKKVVTSLDFQEEVNTGAEEVNTAEGVNTGSTKVSTVSGQVSTDSITKSIPSPDKGQREGKAPMIIKEAPKKTKEQILEEEASLAEAIRLDTLEKRMKRQINTLGGHWKAISAEDFRFFKEVKEEFDKLVKQVESFAPINFEATKDSLKRFGEELQTKTSKRLKSDEAKDDEPTKKTGKRRKQMARKGLHTDLDKDDSEDSDEAMNKMILSVPKIPINPVPVAMKSPSIATYKIIKQGERGVYQIVREDGTDIVYINFGAKV